MMGNFPNVHSDCVWHQSTIANRVDFHHSLNPEPALVIHELLLTGFSDTCRAVSNTLQYGGRDGGRATRFKAWGKQLRAFSYP